MACSCCIVPPDVLKRLARDPKVSAAARKAASDTARLSTAIRKLRDQAGEITRVVGAVGASRSHAIATKPKVTVYDCKQTQTLPGSPVANPGWAADATAKRTFVETTGVAKFYKKAFDRNSIDDAAMTLMSSIHYGVKFNNAMWNGTQMLYGDGDAQLFVDFTRGNDVIGHELTHGVTQHSLQLAYAGDAGGLNESISDCFGSMFRQWEAKQDVTKADWLIGSDILGPAARSAGYTSLRNMANPADKKALAPQPTKYSQLTPTMDPHYTSGPPNLAFCLACQAAGGRSWETVGLVWYRALTGFAPSPNMKMKTFANRTRAVAKQLFPANPKIAAAIDSGWKQVGL